MPHHFGAGACYFFNPFGNSAWERHPSFELKNPPELYEWLIGRASSDSDFGQRVTDIIAAGDIFDTISGAVGLAVGFQRRVDTAKVVSLRQLGLRVWC